MSDPTIALLASFADSLANLNVPKDEHALPLLYAKIFLRRAIEEGGRRSLAELQADTLRELVASFEVNREILHVLLLDKVLVNPDFGIVIKEDTK